MIKVSKTLLLGADAVGKTTLLYKLKLNKFIQTIPTIGFNVEDIKYKDRIIRMFDIGGGDKIKYLWKHYMEGSQCIIYILNLGDKERLDYYIECFNILIEQHKNYNNIPIIIFGNKFNDKIEFEPEEMLQKSNLPPEISPYILKGNIITGEGISELLEYIYNNIEFKEEQYEEKEDKNEEKVANNETIKNNENYLIRMFGLDNSGKTTILFLLKSGKKINTIPTIGYNCEIIKNKNHEKNLDIWDIGGKEIIRALWINYLNNIDGIIWVYDISDKQTYEESQNELKKLLNNSNIKPNLPLLIFANKSDLNEAENQIEDFINDIKDNINDRPYYIKECNQNDLNSYKEGLEWLYNNLN